MSELPLEGSAILRECEAKFEQAVEKWAEGGPAPVLREGEGISESNPSENIFLDSDKVWSSDQGAWIMLIRPGLGSKGILIERDGICEELAMSYGAVVLYKHPGDARKFSELGTDDLTMGTSFFISDMGHVVADFGVLDPEESDQIAETIRDSKIVDPPKWITEALNE